MAKKRPPVFAVGWAVVDVDGAIWWGNGHEWQAAVFRTRREAQDFLKRLGNDEHHIERVRVVSQ